MTEREALNMALQALETLMIERGSIYDKAITAIREALAQPWEKFCDSNCVWTDHHPDCKLAEQEPVAFVKGCNKGQWEIFPAKAYQIFEREQPLYTSPQPVQQQEQLREENERLHVENRRLIDRIETIGVPVGVGGFATTTTAQRTWVGLTLDERIELAQDVDWAVGAYCEYAEKIESKLKEKNEFC